ncbi:DNA-3-methyladenine glycosylase [Aequorivita sp. H23M31]|uniref:Putative 3-methyladenine DNA glycosylase n=1 Tax=Aequorivita ciconiae TaxID=2494375 RepID=A0A410G0E4_9FLAO|nr:DNA-3-methyladenine glycosylase [Aequorivita sp. H23M31]QAA80701.1 DNA-3-methyladenine glycosylase [Aequorivita sp. H23M31]
MLNKKLDREYFRSQNSLVLAEDLLGKILVRDFGNGHILRAPILETEAYLGANDLASHASKGRTQRTEIMFAPGGVVYAYLIYGVHWMLNIVTGPKDHPEAVLIRGVENCIGPGRVGKLIGLDRSFYGENLEFSKRIWIEDAQSQGDIITSTRIGIDYAGEIWKNKPWRFTLKTRTF